MDTFYTLHTSTGSGDAVLTNEDVVGGTDGRGLGRACRPCKPRICPLFIIRSEQARRALAWLRRKSSTQASGQMWPRPHPRRSWCTASVSRACACAPHPSRQSYLAYRGTIVGRVLCCTRVCTSACGGCSNCAQQLPTIRPATHTNPT